MGGKIKGSYGIDAPYVPVLMLVVAVVCGVFAVFKVWSTPSIVWIVIGLAFVVQAAIYLNTTLRGKFKIWRTIISDLGLKGDERALDVGCGRGMVLITTAGSLPNGTSVGIELWRSRDQSGNDPEVTKANAALNDVGDRVEIKTEDMTELSFPDASFDVVTANVAIQNVKDRQLRKHTIDEILRVTKPGGRIRIVDMQYVNQYRDDLVAAGATDVKVKYLGLNGVFGNMFAISRLVSASKPV